MIKSNDILKDTLKSVHVSDICCIGTVLSIAFRFYGLLHRRDGKYFLEFKHDDAGIIRRIIDLYGKFAGSMIEREIVYNESKYWVSFTAERSLLSELNILADDGTWLPELEINTPCCRRSALQEIVLYKGYLLAFKEAYQLEIRIKDDLYILTKSLLEQAGIKFYEYERRIILKGACHLQELFTYLQCPAMNQTLAEQALYNENKNKTVLLTNYSMANVSRQVDSYEHYKDIIEAIDEKIGLENLPDTLRDAAFVRLENPSLSFEEMGQLFSTPISKGGVSSRMKKLERLYQTLGGKT